MRESLRDTIRRVLSGSMLVTAATVPATPAAASDSPSIATLPRLLEVKDAAGAGEIVLRERRPRLVLKRAAESTLELVSSHRSHRSHSSHRSHYSSSGGGRRSPTTRSRPRPAPVYSPPSYSSGWRTAELGDRILVRGMRGSDVAELMRLLVLHGFLASSDVNAQALFDLDVEIAVKAFQRSRQVQVDGKVGPVTARLLRRTSSGN